MSKPLISIILPMYNEENIIIDTLTSIETHLKKQKKYNYEIIVIDDNSEDNSYYKVIGYINKIGNTKKNKKIKVFSNIKNQGKGFSVVRGLMMSEGDNILAIDCDLSTNINQLPKLLKYAKKNDLIISSRYLKSSQIKKKQSLLRMLYSRVYNILVRILFNLNFKDTQNGFTLYSKNLAKKIHIYSNIKRFSFNVEHIIIAKLNFMNVKEVPIVWQDKKPNKVKLSQIKNMALDLIKIKINQFKGLYK